MQPNEITVAVDVLNNGTTTNKIYQRFDDSTPNKSLYVTSVHTMMSRDTLALFRTFPKPSGNFAGVSRTTIKFSRDVIVPGVDSTTNQTSQIIAEVNFSIPVGINAAQTKEVRQQVIGLLDLDSIMGPLNDSLMI